tara:strand:+ start:329 stop:928 length:600 start_codon:yes stop_codon:yes gene_type:complete
MRGKCVNEGKASPDAVDDEALWKESCEFSFDIRKLQSRLRNAEGWQQIIQAHLYLDHVISQMLTEALLRPQEIDADRMSFDAKLRLVRAMGLVPDELAGAPRKINKLRNRLAHDLDYELDQKLITELRSVIPIQLKQAAAETAQKDPADLNLFELLQVTIIQLEIFRQKAKYERLHNAKARKRLRRVLDEVKAQHPDIF